MNDYPGFLVYPPVQPAKCARPCAGGVMRWSVALDHDKRLRKVFSATNFQFCTICGERVYDTENAVRQGEAGKPI